jgi:hypothetical protein
MLPDLEQVLAPMDIFAGQINAKDIEFARTYALLCKVPTRLIPEAMEVFADVMAEHATSSATTTPTQLQYASTMVDFLSPMCFF